MLLFLAVVFGILAVAFVAWTIGELSENDGRHAVSTILAAIVLGALCVTLAGAHKDLKVYKAQVGTLNNVVQKEQAKVASLEYINISQRDELRASKKDFDQLKTSLMDARFEVADAQKDAKAARTELGLVKVELKAALEATKFDRAELEALKVENSDLKTQLQGIMEVVQ